MCVETSLDALKIMLFILSRSLCLSMIIQFKNSIALLLKNILKVSFGHDLGHTVGSWWLGGGGGGGVKDNIRQK